MNTPSPCDRCDHLYSDCMCEDDPSYSAECKLDLPMGRKDCKKFSDEKIREMEKRYHVGVKKEAEMKQHGLVIVGVDKDSPEEIQYYAIDHSSGGYPYWNNFPGYMKIFPDTEAGLEEAQKILEGSFFVGEHTAGTTKYPAMMVHSGAHLCNKKKKGTLIVHIARVELKPVFSKEFEAEIKEGEVT